MTRTAGLAALVLAIGGGVSAVPPCRYTVEMSSPINCGSFGTAAISPQDINDSGVVCGWWWCPVGGLNHAFVWDAVNGMREPTLPPGTIESLAWAISDSGVITGTYVTKSDSEIHVGVFISQGDSVSYIPDQGGGVTDANEDGWFAGTWVPTPGSFAPFRWPAKGKFEDLSPLLGRTIGQAYGEAISADGTVCGRFEPNASQATTHGFLISPNNTVTTIPPLPGYVSSELTAINGLNVAVGISTMPPAIERQGFIFDHGIVTPLPPYPHPLPPGVELYSVPESINDDAVVVGFWVNGLDFVYHDGQIEELARLVGDSINRPRGLRINNAGQIAGIADLAPLDWRERAFVATPVPPVPGDTNCDETVNVDDLLGVINHWNGQGVREDLNEDGVVNHLDLLDVIRHWSFNGS